MKLYYITSSGKQAGPFPEEELKDQISSGRFNRNDFYWTEAMEQWKPIHEAIELANALPKTPPPFKAGVINKAMPVKGNHSEKRHKQADTRPKSGINSHSKAQSPNRSKKRQPKKPLNIVIRVIGVGVVWATAFPLLLSGVDGVLLFLIGGITCSITYKIWDFRY
ncbi:DUF4339 domain-containing protein [Coraliomargarita algicola]|uniref:DUF4339 domain-containing protein n=1 Tax=Coraliomargarita algicola TaxID=3092156 RepID=A0ABZ0RHW4_9BACT|nr:DUF4339 domain-containing protein [Coraliomargarita sp. J2-16]WPJ94385.1 DUF4339 domain-containing protein [Coraliomargarita sp. J2-16]